MMKVSRTHAIVLTPPGRGAVATVLVAGEQAVEIVGGLFRPASGRPLADFASGRIVFGRWGEAPGEELVVCRRTDDQVEIHCHGGNAAVRAIVDALIAAGCQATRWQDWKRRQAVSRVQADALEDLARATTLRTAAILLDQYHGALDREIEAISTFIASAKPANQAAALQRLSSLFERARMGLHLVEPFQVVLAGRPNAGKSSLVNALLGYKRSIVHDRPGTTRDVVTAGTAFDGLPVELADTAGLRCGGDPLEAAGIALAEQRLAAAELRILVFDASQPCSDDDRQLLERWPDALVVHSKCDLVRAVPASSGVITSAVTGHGIEELAKLIARRLVPEPPEPGAAVPFRAWQVETLRQAADACARGDFAAVSELLAKFRQ